MDLLSLCAAHHACVGGGGSIAGTTNEATRKRGRRGGHGGARRGSRTFFHYVACLVVLVTHRCFVLRSSADAARFPVQGVPFKKHVDDMRFLLRMSVARLRAVVDDRATTKPVILAIRIVAIVPAVGNFTVGVGGKSDLP